MNVDGGYVSYKLSFGGYDVWELEKGEHISIMAMEGSSRRKQLSAEYKASRERDVDELSRVEALRNKIQREQLLPVVQLDGLEADDLVACWYLFEPFEDIIGVDKDFFQLPALSETYHHDGRVFSKAHVISRLPIYLQPLATKNFALYQMVAGDKTDGIPRLLSRNLKEAKDQVALLLDTKYYYEVLTSLFGEKVIDNAKMVLMPFFEEMNDPFWFTHWCNGDYYNRVHWQQLMTKIIENKAPNTYGGW